MSSQVLVLVLSFLNDSKGEGIAGGMSQGLARVLGSAALSPGMGGRHPHQEGPSTHTH